MQKQQPHIIIIIIIIIISSSNQSINQSMHHDRHMIYCRATAPAITVNFSNRITTHPHGCERLRAIVLFRFSSHSFTHVIPRCSIHALLSACAHVLVI